MTTEIERRFLPGHLPERIDLGPGTGIRQGYLAGEGSVSVRMRIADDAATITVKAGRGLVRTEVELLLSADHAEALWPHTEGRRLDKVRHRVPLTSAGDLVAEIDCFLGALAGLVLIEVEFDTVEASAAFEPPAWFGTEITGRPEWSNAALARHGRPTPS
jgi:CYTH domain-containing protein